MVNDVDGLSDLQWRVLEPDDQGATWPSGMWTRDEVVGYLNQRQNRFMRDSLLQASEATINALPLTERHALPDDWITTIRVAWKALSGRVTPLPRTDLFEADHGIPAWPTTPASRPLLYYDAETPITEIAVVPPASDAGQIHLLYVGLAAVLGDLVNPDIFTVPDEFVPAVLYGVIADMLGKVGQAHDPTRAAYCERRYQEGVAVARLILSGGV